MGVDLWRRKNNVLDESEMAKWVQGWARRKVRAENEKSVDVRNELAHENNSNRRDEQSGKVSAVSMFRGAYGSVGTHSFAWGGLTLIPESQVATYERHLQVSPVYTYPTYASIAHRNGTPTTSVIVSAR